VATIVRSPSLPAEALSAPVTPLFGVGLKILSALSFTFMSAGVKWVGSDYPTGQIVFFRSAFALVPLLVWLGLRGDLLASVRTNDLRSHVIRGLIGSCGMFAGFVALSYLPLSDAVVIGYLAPLLTVVLAAVFLGETVRVYRWTAVLVGFVGVLVMVWPHLGTASLGGGAQGTTIGIAFGLLGACCAAGATIQVRRLTRRESTGAIVLYFTLLTTALGACTVVLGWKMPSPSHFALLVAVGILGGIGQILMTQSYRYADASLIAPFDYTTMIWAFLLGWFLFGQLPGAAVVLGGGIVAAAGLFVIWREHRLGLQRARQVETGSQRAM
jgi:drug/metabolite transporter (DMT)-like permease